MTVSAKGLKLDEKAVSRKYRKKNLRVFVTWWQKRGLRLVEKIVFTDSWQRFFGEFGLVSFDDFFQYSRGETVNRNNKRNVLAFELGGDSEQKQFFMKRFFHPHFKDMLFTWRNFGEPCSQARCEWENIKLLCDNGIGTYRPACYAEKKKWGLERKSFIITEKIQGQALTDFVKQNWQQLDRYQKEKIITELAGFIRRIHEGRFNLPDLYVWHIFLKENQAAGKWEFSVIDLHRMTHNVTNKGEQLKNLGRLLHSMIDRYFDEGLKRLFIESYAADNSDGGVVALAAKVKKYSDKISARRKPKRY